MRINSISLISFSSKQNADNNKNNKISNISNGVSKNKKEFYNQIDKYLNKEFDKVQYLKEFKNEMINIREKGNGRFFTNIEKKYMRDLLMTLDYTDKLEQISDKYLKENMKNLLSKK